MPTLAFDTSTSIGAVAVIDGGRLLTERTWNRDTSHGELLTPAIEETLQSAGISFSLLTRLIVGIGPGSFTGCRISVNVARALSFALKLSVYPIDTFELIAAAVPPRSQPLLVALRGQKNSTLASTFVWKSDRWARTQSLGSLAISDFERQLDLGHGRSVEHDGRDVERRAEPYLGVGSAFQGNEFPEKLKSKILREPGLSDQVDASSFLTLDRLIELDQRLPSDWKALQALYLRASSAEERRDEGFGKRGP